MFKPGDPVIIVPLQTAQCTTPTGDPIQGKVMKRCHELCCCEPVPGEPPCECEHITYHVRWVTNCGGCCEFKYDVFCEAELLPC